MPENSVSTIDENTRRYYLDVMGIQCWESLDTAEHIGSELHEARADEKNDLDLASLETVIQQCDKCQLHKSRKQALSGRGNQSADLMFVLISPDANDDKAAQICSGEAYNLLAKMLTAIGVSIDDVYITSLLKCCVPTTHTVSTTEIHHCNQYLKQQVHLVKPKLLVVLGETSVRCLLQKNMALDDLRVETNNEQSSYFESVPIFVSYSPQELLRQPENKRKAWSDLQQMQKIIQA